MLQRIDVKDDGRRGLQELLVVKRRYGVELMNEITDSDLQVEGSIV